MCFGGRAGGENPHLQPSRGVRKRIKRSWSGGSLRSGYMPVASPTAWRFPVLAMRLRAKSAWLKILGLQRKLWVIFRGCALCAEPV